MINSASFRSKMTCEAYEDALDSIRFYASKHPEWRQILVAIQDYVSCLESETGLHEPGV